MATLLPLVAFSAVNQIETFRKNRRAAALESASFIAHAVRENLLARVANLQILALMPELQAGDFEKFRLIAETVIARELSGSNMLVLRRDGQQEVNTRVPPGQPLPRRADPAAWARTAELFETGQPSVSDLFFGIVVRRPVVAIEVPVKDRHGAVIYSLALNPTPEAFEKIVNGGRPFSARVTLFDRQGVTIAHSADRGNVGQKVADTVWQKFQTDGGGVLESVDADGRAVSIALRKVEEFGWGIAAEQPGAEITRAALRSALPTFLAGGLIILTSLALGALVARGITRPMNALRDMVAGREPDPQMLNRLPEAKQVGEAYREAQIVVAERTAALEKTIAQRDLLLREVYHRVKNNLQAVDSLLNMECRRLSDEQAIRALKHLRNRIHALGLVHAQLMTSEDFYSFDITPFLLALAENMAATLSTEKRTIKIITEADAVYVTLDVALPLSLLLTELITNAAKHAYGDRDGTIRVRFTKEAGGGVLLTVEDDGRNPDAPANLAASRGLGTKLIAGFMGQLDGHMDVHFENGLRIQIFLPLTETRNG